MAHIIPFVNGKKEKGWTIGSLPMPDGTKRTYKEFGRNALKIILQRWQADKIEMEAAMFLKEYQG